MITLGAVGGARSSGLIEASAGAFGARRFDLSAALSLQAKAEACQLVRGFGEAELRQITEILVHREGRVLKPGAHLRDRVAEQRGWDG
jgi:hypothetical protein